MCRICLRVISTGGRLDLINPGGEGAVVVDWDGVRYAEVSALQRMVAEVSIGGLELAGNERLLDVGCGDGFITMQLAQRLPAGSVVGVDASRRMIEKALTRVPAEPAADPADLLRVQFHVDDALALPFERDFDIAVSFNALHWIHDQTAALQGIARSLDDGGRAVIQVVCATSRPSIEDVAMEVAASSRWRGYFPDFDAPYFHVVPDRFREFADTAGFTVDDLAVQDLQWQFDSSEAFAQWFSVGATDWTDRIPMSGIDDFVSEVIDRYERITGEPALLRFSQLRAALTLSQR